MGTLTALLQWEVGHALGCLVWVRGRVNLAKGGLFVILSKLSYGSHWLWGQENNIPDMREWQDLGSGKEWQSSPTPGSMGSFMPPLCSGEHIPL